MRGTDAGRGRIWYQHEVQDTFLALTVFFSIHVIIVRQVGGGAGG